MITFVKFTYELSSFKANIRELSLSCGNILTFTFDHIVAKFTREPNPVLRENYTSLPPFDIQLYNTLPKSSMS